MKPKKTAAASEIKGLISEKVAASGDLGSLSWDWPGMWAHWAFDVRALYLDGELFSPTVGVARFTSTVGCCRTANDWRYFLIADDDGEGVPITSQRKYTR